MPIDKDKCNKMNQLFNRLKVTKNFNHDDTILVEHIRRALSIGYVDDELISHLERMIFTYNI